MRTSVCLPLSAVRTFLESCRSYRSN